MLYLIYIFELNGKLINILKAAFFDLFFTLIVPEYQSEQNEYDILNMTKSEWEHFAENDALYYERALGRISDKNEIIRKIALIIPFHVTEQQQREILIQRQNRMKSALMSVDECVLDTLTLIHNKGIKLCLISNADKIDSEYWKISPLADVFDEAIFSCDIGILKPDKKIYDYAMKRIKVTPAESIFIGDGGSDELIGAKQAGMLTVFTEYLDKKDEIKSQKLRTCADYHIDNFVELIDIIL